MSRYKFWRAVLLTAALTAFVAGSSARQPAAPESADLTGKYELTGGGYLVMSVNDAGRVEGFFERGGEFGRISGQAESGAVSATWIQESGSTACKTAVDGSNFWGKLTLTRDADGAVQTAWGSCEARPVAAEPAK